LKIRRVSGAGDTAMPNSTLLSERGTEQTERSDLGFAVGAEPRVARF